MIQTSCNFPLHWYKLQVKGRTLTIESRAYHIETKKGNNRDRSNPKRAQAKHFCKRNVKVTFLHIIMEIDYHANRGLEIMHPKIIMPIGVCGLGTYTNVR